MKARHESKQDGVIYISGVMDEETRPVIFSALNDLKAGEGMLVIFRLPKEASSDQLLEFNIKDFSPQGQWDSVSDKVAGGAMQSVVMRLAEEVNEKRLPNIVFSQGEEKVKATDDHAVCFGVIGGPNSGKITKIKTIVHQQLNMGLNGDLLLHESNLIMNALYHNQVIVKDAPLSVRSYGAGGSSSHKVHPGDILTSDAVIDIRTHVNPLYSIKYLQRYLTNVLGLSTEHPEFPAEINNIIRDIRERFLNDPSYSGLAIVSDVEALINAISDFIHTAPRNILAGMNPEEKEYYGEISLSNSSQGTRVIQRISNPSFKGNEGQKAAKKEIIRFMNKMGEYEGLKSRINNLRKKRDIVARRYHKQLLEHAAIQEKAGQSKNNREIEVLSEAARVARYRKLAEQKDALEKELKGAIVERDGLLVTADIESKCAFLRSEINQLKKIQLSINPERPFVVTASGNIFFNHAEKESVHQFGAALVEMENQLFKQTIHKAIMDGCYIESELVTKIAADPVCIPAEVNTRLNNWAAMCTMTLEDYVSAYLWASAGKKQDMSKIPPCGLWQPANQVMGLEYPCGIIRIDINPLEMPHSELKALLGNTPSYIVYQDKFFYADDMLDVEDLGPATEETRALIAQLKIPYNSEVAAHMNCSIFREITHEEQDEIENVTKHRHRATYKRLFYSLSVWEDSSQEDESISSEGTAYESQILNPFWKEIGVDLLSEIANGKAFSGSIFEDISKDDKRRQEQLQSRANNIARLPEADADAARDLFRDYLNYMVSKVPSAELQTRKISIEDECYPVYARNAIYKTGYVSGPVKDWDAAIYKSNNSAVLVGVIDKFLRDVPVSAVGSEAVVVYKEQDNHDNELTPSDQESENDDLSSDFDEAEEQETPQVHKKQSNKSFTLPLPIQSLVGATDLLLKLQSHPKLEPHHQESLRELVNTLLTAWENVARESSNGNYKKNLSLFCNESRQAINKAEQAFKHQGVAFSLIRPLLNLFIQGINLIQRLIFREPKEMPLFKKGPTSEQLKQWQKINTAVGKLCECLEKPVEIEMQVLTQMKKS